MRHRKVMTRCFLGSLVVFLAFASLPSAGAASLDDTVRVAIDPKTSSVVLGENLDLHVAVTNNGSAATPPLIIHLDITDPEQNTSVDPEDWTPTLSQPVGEVAPGETVLVSWRIQPISAGTFSTYAVALSPGVESVAASNVLEVRVADERSLNPGGILPVALGAPAFVGGLLLLQTRFAKRIMKKGGARRG